MSQFGRARLRAALALLLFVVTSSALGQEPMDAGVSADAGLYPLGMDAQVEPVVDVSVRGRSRAQSLRRSAYAVSVVDLEQAKQQTVDLGEVLARSTAITVQRAGGLGSRGSFALGGLGGDRLRFFLDGVPLELMGYVAGVQNVPVNLIERVEVYQGVVPARFGSDALGGAVHLVTEENVRKSAAAASYQLGDFGTHRVTAAGRYFHAPTGLFARGSVFFDKADNDYKVDVETFNDQGQTYKVRVPRFHDGYAANGFNVGVGVADKRWAERLLITGFRSAFDNDVQNGATMNRPYGDVTFARQTFGVNARYAIARASKGIRFEATAGYTRLDSQFRDLSGCVYDWYGRCSPRGPNLRGEITGMAQSTDLQTDTLFLRAEVSQRLSEMFRLRIALAPTYSDRSGKMPLRGFNYDPLAQPRRLFTGVLGVELETSLFDGLVKNVSFVKGYSLATRSEAFVGTGEWLDRSKTLMRAGGGDSVRVDLTRELYVKTSYEYTLRQPSTDELFGDGMLTNENLELKPERSHNANLALQLDDWETVAGSWRVMMNGFARWSRDMISLLATQETLQSINITDARALGVEAGFGWSTPKLRWLNLDGRITYQDLRNQSAATDFTAAQPGDRIPSTPYLFATGMARLHGEAMLVARDSVDLTWNVRYVHAFPYGWESQAQNAENKLVIPHQVSHGLALTYKLAGRFTTTAEAQNLANAKLYDFYGVQRPGRAFFAKWTVDY